jgi:hypothetical protein
MALFYLILTLNSLCIPIYQCPRKVILSTVAKMHSEISTRGINFEAHHNGSIALGDRRTMDLPLPRPKEGLDSN